jgi:DNA repair protein RadC
MKATKTARSITLPDTITAPDGTQMWTEDDVLLAAERIATARFAARDRITFTNPANTRRYLAAKYRGRPAEVFVGLFVDSQHRLIEECELFHGTIDGASVYPREIVRAAIERQAAAVIFAHNHPSGIAEPSLADRQITRRLIDALAMIDVRVLDHFVIGADEPVSFAERGLL